MIPLKWMKKTNNPYCLQTGKTIFMWSMNVFPILKGSTKISGYIYILFIFIIIIIFKYRITWNLEILPILTTSHFLLLSWYLSLHSKFLATFSFAFHILYLYTHWTIVNESHMMVVFMRWVLNQAPHSLNWESIRNQILSHAASVAERCVVGKENHVFEC